MSVFDLPQAVILTGKRAGNTALLAGTGLENKTLLPVAGQPILAHILKTLANCRYQPEIYISTSEMAITEFASPVPFKVLPSEADAVHSLLSALDSLPPLSEEASPWVLFVSGDHALLTPEMLDYFVRQAVRKDRALMAAVVERKVVRAAYPQSIRTYFHARNGAYSGGNLFLINRRKFSPNSRFMETMDHNRKKPWKSALMLSPLSLLQILLRRLDIHQVAEKASKALGCSAGVVEMPFAECCMDVDKPSDLILAEQILRKRRRGASIQGVSV